MFATRLWGWTTLLVLAFNLPGWGQEPPRQLRPVKGRVDLYGDPLPQGVIARLGTVRFRHYGAVHAVAFSKDGKLLAASSDGWNMVVIWERATGRKLREIRVADRGFPPTYLHFSPDGKRLYSFDGTLCAWDVETGAVAKDVPLPPAGARVLGYSTEAQEVILLHEAEIVRWDIDKGKELGRYPKPEGYLSVAARVGTRLLVPQFGDRAVIMWGAARKKRLWSVEATRDKNYPVLPMAFSADGKLFAVEAPPQMISVYESITGRMVRRFKGDAGKIYYALAISPDARTLAGSNWDGSLRLWDLESGRQRAKVPTIQGWTTNIFFAPDSKTFATGGPNNAHSVLLWKTATGEPITPFAGHTSPVSSVSISPDGRMAATSSKLRDDPVVRLWDTQTARLLRSLEAPDGGGVSAVAFSPDGGTLAACSWSGERKVRLWDTATGRERQALVGHQGGCTCVAFSTDGKRLVSGDAYYNRGGHYEGRLCIWDTERGKLIREIRGTRGAIQRVLFTRDGRHILAAADGVHIYDADTGQLVGEPFPAKSRIWGLALSADGQLLATADGHRPVRLWELATCREIPTSVPGNGHDVALTPDGRILAAGTSEEGIVLFHWPSGETVGKLLDEAGIRSRLVFSPDGRRLATAENDESSALIWDVAGLVNRPLPKVAKPAEVDLRRWWADLRDGNPGEAYKAVWRFAAVPRHALPFLADSLQSVKAVEPAIIARWIDDLDNSRFQVREGASRELERLGEAVADDLRKAKKKDGISLEQKQRIDLLLAKLASLAPSPEQLRALRTIAVLEQIGGSEARKILTRLGSGASGAQLTREAKAALGRLKRGEK